MKTNYSTFLKGGILAMLISISFFSKAQEKAKTSVVADSTRPGCQPKPVNSDHSVVHEHGQDKGNCNNAGHPKDSTKLESFVFPNPLPQGEKGKLSFSNDSTSHYTVHLFNASGAEVNKVELDADKSFAAGQLLPADYFYVIRDHKEGVVSRGRFAVK